MDHLHDVCFIAERGPKDITAPAGLAHRLYVSVDLRLERAKRLMNTH